MVRIFPGVKTVRLMATAKTYILKEYEVLKTRTGRGIGMTRHWQQCCHTDDLSSIVNTNTNRTHVYFNLYSPLSRDERIVMFRDHIVHRSRVINNLFLYDGLVLNGSKMIDEESMTSLDIIEQIIDQNIDQRIRDAMERLAEQYDLDFEEHDEEWGLKDEEFDDFYDVVLFFIKRYTKFRQYSFERWSVV